MRLHPLLLLPVFAPVALLAQAFPSVPTPPQNPTTAAKVLLGKALFWEEQMSSTDTVACGTCHVFAAGGGDPRTTVPVNGQPGTVNPGPDGVFGTFDDTVGSLSVVGSLADGSYAPVGAFGLRPQVTRRKSPSPINAAFGTDLAWDGGARDAFVDPADGVTVLVPVHGGLESQSARPPVSSGEMGHAGIVWADVTGKLARVQPLALASALPAPLQAFVAGRSYPQLFAQVYGTSAITPARVAMAVAAYQRTLVADQSRYDDYVAGNTTALTPSESNGLNLFLGVGNCAQCHVPPLFTDGSFRNIGVASTYVDPGRNGVTQAATDLGRFRVPGLRNVALRAPFFHDGRTVTLAAALDFYVRGGDFHLNQDPLIVPLSMTAQERTDLLAFLQALTDPRVAAEQPPFDRPRLYGESNHVPRVFGQGSPGGGGSVPSPVCVEPPYLGNPGFTLGVGDANGGAFGWLVMDYAAAPQGFPFGGVTCWLGLTPLTSVRAVGPLHGVGIGNGYASITVPLPVSPVWRGVTVYGQWLVADAVGAFGLAASPAMAVTLY